MCSSLDIEPSDDMGIKKNQEKGESRLKAGKSGKKRKRKKRPGKKKKERNEEAGEVDSLEEDWWVDNRDGGDIDTLGMLNAGFAGAMMIVIAVLGFLNPYFLLWSGQGSDISSSIGLADYFCGILSIVFGIFCFMGAVAALKRRFLAVAMFGAVMGSLTIGMCGLNLFLGLVSLGLIYKSREAFK